MGLTGLCDWGFWENSFILPNCTPRTSPAQHCSRHSASRWPYTQEAHSLVAEGERETEGHSVKVVMSIAQESKQDKGVENDGSGLLSCIKRSETFSVEVGLSGVFNKLREQDQWPPGRRQREQDVQRPWGGSVLVLEVVCVVGAGSVGDPTDSVDCC